MPPEEEHIDPAERAAEANAKRNADRLARMEAIANGVDDGYQDDGMRETDGDHTFELTPEEIEARETRAQEDSERELAQLQAKGLQEEGGAKPETRADEKLINGVNHYLAVVNGREKWLTLTQLRDSAQKVQSADEYLSNAKEAARNASQLALSPTDDVPAQLGKDELRKLLAASALGDEDAIDALASVLSRPSVVTPDVVQQIDQRLSFRTELAQLESEHREILENPWTARLLRDRLNELKSEDPSMRLTDAYRKIGGEIREAFPEKFKTSPGATLDHKRERKRTLVNAPTAAGRASVGEDSGDELDYEQTVAAGISALAKARGQATPKIAENQRDRRKA